MKVNKNKILFLYRFDTFDISLGFLYIFISILLTFVSFWYSLPMFLAFIIHTLIKYNHNRIHIYDLYLDENLIIVKFMLYNEDRNITLDSKNSMIIFEPGKGANRLIIRDKWRKIYLVQYNNSAWNNDEFQKIETYFKSIRKFNYQ